jgi:hypothetical protein
MAPNRLYEKWNTKIYIRYRAACDFFFRSKTVLHISSWGVKRNSRKKKCLCDRAEALKIAWIEKYDKGND